MNNPIRLEEGQTVGISIGTEYNSGGLGPCIGLLAINNQLSQEIIGVMGHYNFENQIGPFIEKIQEIENISSYTIYIAGGESIDNQEKKSVLNQIHQAGFTGRINQKWIRDINGSYEIIVDEKGGVEIAYDEYEENETREGQYEER